MLPPAAASLDEAHAAIELWEHYKRRRLDDTQRLAVEVMMATRSDGLWAASTTGREMPRQNGKGDEIEVVELWALVQRSERILHTIHDAVLLATETQTRLLSVIDGHPDLRRLKLRAWRGTGQQMIEMRNGGIIWYRTRTGGGARGVDEVDRIVIDEAQHAENEHLEAVTPTQLASVNPQLNALGTSGLDGKSVWWWRMRRRALSDTPGNFGYVGHTAERVSLADGRVVRNPVDVHDRALWWASNPALKRTPEKIAFLEEQLQTLGEEGFAQEHLGVWAAEPLDEARQVKLPQGAWKNTVGPDLPAGAPIVAVAFDVSKDGEWASIAISAGSLESPYVEVAMHRQGAGWLSSGDVGTPSEHGELVRIIKAHNPAVVACNGAGPAGMRVGPILAAFREAGISADLLVQMKSREYVQACGGFYNDVVEGRLRRPAGQGELDRAASDAGERLLGEAWAWDRRSATVPISPLVAVTIARAFLPTEPPKGPPKKARVLSF